MNATIDLDDDLMSEAAQNFFASEWADAWEEAGFTFAAGTEITEVCPLQATQKLLELVRPYVADLDLSWGRSVGEMFTLMEIPEGEWAEALYYVLMGCRGHGVGLEDDHGENIEIARAKLGFEIDPSPFHSEFTEFADLAHEVVEAEALMPDTNPDPNDTFQTGNRVRIETRMPSGDTLKGIGGFVRYYPSGDHGNADEGVIVRMDDSDSIEPWSYSGRTVFVESHECELA
jgi:hypothetical protein